MASILSENQVRILDLICKENSISRLFYLSGGTALAEYYLQHRLSEDLDFFSEEEFDPLTISIFLKKIQSEAGIKKIRYEQSFNRNLYFLTLDNDEIKMEFTYYPFPRIEKGKDIGGIEIDSLLDIAVNKVFTIYQRPRSRDFIDLYLIMKKEKWSLDELVRKAQIKFDNYLDPIQLGAQLIKVTEVKDYPRMKIEIDPKIWQDFFLNEAKKLGDKILEK